MGENRGVETGAVEAGGESGWLCNRPKGDQNLPEDRIFGKESNMKLNPNGKIARYLARIDRATCPANKKSLEVALPTVLENNSKELFFATAMWYRPYSRRGVTLARHFATGILAGGRGPRVLKVRNEDDGDGTTFRYGTGFLIEWDVYPTQEPVVSGSLSADALFGRGGDRQTAESALKGVPYWVHTQQ